MVSRTKYKSRIVGGHPGQAGEQAATLMETLVGAVVFLLLLGMLFYIYRMGASAWMKADTQVELIGPLQVVNDRLEREVERSVYDSFSLDSSGNGVAFLSAVDANGVFHYDPVTEKPKWQKYLIFYYDPTAGEIRLREVSVVGTPQEDNPAPIETFSGNPLSSYFTQGRVLARGVTSCMFSLTADQQVVVEATAEKNRYGSSVPERVSLRGQAYFRN